MYHTLSGVHKWDCLLWCRLTSWLHLHDFKFWECALKVIVLLYSIIIDILMNIIHRIVAGPFLVDFGYPGWFTISFLFEIVELCFNKHAVYCRLRTSWLKWQLSLTRVNTDHRSPLIMLHKFVENRVYIWLIICRKYSELLLYWAGKVSILTKWCCLV